MNIELRVILNSYLIESHQFLGVHFFGLVQWHEFDVLGRQSIVGEGTRNGVKIMGTDRNQGSLTGKVLVQLVLEGNEGFVTRLIKSDIAKDSTGDVWADLCGLLDD